LEDDSAASVAKDIVGVWIETKEGKDNTVRKFEGLVDKIKGKRIEVKETVESDESDDEDWEDDEGEEGYVDDEDNNVPQLIEHHSGCRNAPVVDDDGFTLVQGKGKGRR